MIIVDEIQHWPTKIRCFKQGSCHLMTDDGNLAELHAFAEKIGMRRDWFQPSTSPLHAHYDLTVARRKDALRQGATFVPWRTQAKARIAARKTTEMT